MTGEALKNSILAYEPSLTEQGFAARFTDLLDRREDCFHRTCFSPGHITGSALVLSADGAAVLMNHHRSLGRWMNFGGHADGETDILEVARREVLEEAGLQAVPLSLDIFDIDIHPIPANPLRNEPAHEHFDIRYLFRAGQGDFKVSDESFDIKWCSPSEALALTQDSPAMTRLLRKWRESSHLPVYPISFAARK